MVRSSLACGLAWRGDSVSGAITDALTAQAHLDVGLLLALQVLLPASQAVHLRERRSRAAQGAVQQAHRNMTFSSGVSPKAGRASMNFCASSLLPNSANTEPWGRRMRQRVWRRHGQRGTHLELAVAEAAHLDVEAVAVALEELGQALQRRGEGQALLRRRSAR